MRSIRTYFAIGLMLIFCTYYADVSMFSHTHIVNGSSVVHSHLGGGTDHDHSDSQYAVIDILSNFQSESALVLCHLGIPFIWLSESPIGYTSPSITGDVCPVHTLRGPPQA